ncbi:MAG: PAS domain-containing sensor histidine kinase [Chloroflexi bacterium]|nr:MAG: PAS domain-containing sensor histidine kinase [Chloroflexota bacterium]
MRQGAVLEPSRRPLAVAAALAALASLSLAAILQFPILSAPLVSAIDDVGEAVAALIAASACAWAARRSSGRTRLAWSLMSISAAGWAAGDAAWTAYEIGRGVAVPFPSAEDVGFLVAAPFAFASVLAFWNAPRGTASRWRVWLDGLIIALALTFTAWALGLRLIWQDPQDPLNEKLFELAYPVLDILILTVVILAIRRSTLQQQGRMFLLFAGVASYSIADSAFSYLTASGTNGVGGSILDIGWVVGYLLIALAAIWPGSALVRVGDRAPVDLWQLALPWLTVLLAGGIALALAVTGHPLDLFLTALTGIGAALLAGNMVLTHKDFLAMLIQSRASEATLAEVIAQAPAGVVRIGADLRIIEANARFASLLDRGQDFVGSTITQFFTEPDAAAFVAKIEALTSGGQETVEGETESQRADGTKVWMHWSATSVPNARGESEYFIAMFEDTTARHEADAAAAATLELMQRLNSVKTEFLQNVSHEFKTALIGIQGFSEFMRDADQLDVNDARAFATDINRDAERLDRMVTDMLALDQVETTGTALRLSPVDVNILIQREVMAAQKKSNAHPIQLQLEPRLPMVSGDVEKLGDAIRNLLDNAARYSPDGGRITITTSAMGATVTVSVRDEGEAVRSDFDNGLFGDDDVYADNPIRKVVGTGLGLSIVRQVIEMHGGRLWVDRLEGRGLEFHFSLKATAGAKATPAGGKVA